MDEKDKEILEIIQFEFPLCRAPWAAAGSRVSLSPGEVVDRVSSLRRDGYIREISGVFDCVSLGYSQTLAACSVPAEHLDRAGRTVAEHPGVGHCYGRNADYNLWFTLAVSPLSRIGLEKTLEKLAGLVAATGFMNLPAARRFKLSAVFDRSGRIVDIGETVKDKNRQQRDVPCDEDRKAVRALQVDLPAVADPFAEVAAAEGIASEDILLERAERFQASGIMRRYAAMVSHLAVGVISNAMVVWDVDRFRLEEAGMTAAKDPAVSHCYARPACPDWPFSLYTMVHGRRPDDVNIAVERIAAAVDLDGDTDRKILWTGKEYAKRRVRLFTSAEGQWEDLNW